MKIIYISELEGTAVMELDDVLENFQVSESYAEMTGFPASYPYTKRQYINMQMEDWEQFHGSHPETGKFVIAQLSLISRSLKEHVDQLAARAKKETSVLLPSRNICGPADFHREETTK